MGERKAEIEELKNLGRGTKNTRMKLRYDVIRLWLEERKKTEIAELLNTTYQTVTNYIAAYEESGINGLEMKKSPGRNKKLSTQQEKQLYECITVKLPKDVGFEPFVNWTAPLAVQWIKKEFGIEFTERGMRDVFYRLKLSYTRPTYVLKKADPQKQEAFKEEFENLKKN